MSTTGNTARYEIESAEAAAAVIEQFCDVETLAPIQVVSIDQMAVVKAQAIPTLDHTDSGDLALVTSAIQSHLKERAVNELTRFDYGRVSLDVEGHYGRSAWASACPQIVFCALTSQDVTIQSLAGHHSEEHGKFTARAMALYFDPELVGTLPVIDRKTGQQRIDTETGELMVKPDIYNPEGYVAICALYPGVPAAKQALEELRSAVNYLATDPESADETDPFDVPPPGATLTAL